MLVEEMGKMCQLFFSFLPKNRVRRKVPQKGQTAPPHSPLFLFIFQQNVSLLIHRKDSKVFKTPHLDEATV